MKSVSSKSASQSLRAIRSAIEPLEARALLTTLYVDANAPGGTQNGSSWATAYLDLQSALAVSGTAEIRVADGTYKPGSSRTDSFVVSTSTSNYHSVKGGYAGYGAVNPDARSSAVYPTILSGDIGVANVTSDNSYHVVTVAANVSTALDGLTITRGNADGAGANGNGGGLYSLEVPSIVNCIFTENNAVRGGAMYNYEVTSSVFAINVSDSTFSNNTATVGGAIWSTDTDTGISNCTFINNAATSGHGGAIYGEDRSIVLTENCVFTENTASASGGAIYGTYTIVEADNTLFRGNSAGGEGGAIYTEASFLNPTRTMRVIGSNFVGNSAGSAGGGLAVHNDAQEIKNCTFTANSAPTGMGGAIYADYATVTVKNSILWNNDGGEISGSSVAVTNSDVEGGRSGTGNINADPHFVEAPDVTLASPHYGNLELRIGSPAVNAGNDSALVSGASYHNVGVSTDIVGQTRKFGTIDMGAYEQVTNSWVGTGTGSWATTSNWSLGRIPNRYDVASIGTGVTVTVGSGVYEVGQLATLSSLQISSGTLKAFGDTAITGDLTLSSGGSFDMQQYKVTINFSTDPTSTIQSYLASAYNGGNWSGSGLTSSLVAANPYYRWRIGYFNGNTDTVGGAAANQLIIKPLLGGDADGNGVVNQADDDIVDANYNSTSATWADGDFDYDGVVEFDDLVKLAQQFGFDEHGYPLY